MPKIDILRLSDAELSQEMFMVWDGITDDNNRLRYSKPVIDRNSQISCQIGYVWAILVKQANVLETHKVYAKRLQDFVPNGLSKKLTNKFIYKATRTCGILFDLLVKTEAIKLDRPIDDGGDCPHGTKLRYCGICRQETYIKEWDVYLPVKDQDTGEELEWRRKVTMTATGYKYRGKWQKD